MQRSVALTAGCLHSFHYFTSLSLTPRACSCLGAAQIASHSQMAGSKGLKKASATPTDKSICKTTLQSNSSVLQNNLCVYIRESIEDLLCCARVKCYTSCILFLIFAYLLLNELHITGALYVHFLCISVCCFCLTATDDWGQIVCIFLLCCDA